ncbi:MAG: hypothetical protein U0414_20655 [Polyangiaceae bacterium]
MSLRHPWFLALLLTACRLPGAAFVAEERDVKYTSVLDDRPAVAPESVQILGVDELPEGFDRDTTSGQLLVAPRFPSADDPHVILGNLSITEKFDADVDELKAKKPESPDRIAAIKLEAARHGANALIRTAAYYDQGAWGTSFYRGGYAAVYLSMKPKAYPSVDELITRLKLPEGFHEIQRVALDLADLRTATIDVPLKRGSCYLLGLAFEPGEVFRPQKGPDKVTPIDFKLDLPKPLVIPGRNVIWAGAGSLFAYSDKSDGKSWHELDGVWSRAGAGGLMCPVVDDQKGKVSFYTTFGSATEHPPPFNPGKGAAQVIVFEQKLPKAELDEKLCGMCFDISKQCSLRKSLATCEPLQSCLATVHMPFGVCEPFLDQ